MKYSTTFLLCIAAADCIAWEDHPDKEHTFDPDKVVEGVGTSYDRSREDDRGNDSYCSQDIDYGSNRGTFNDPDSSKD